MANDSKTICVFLAEGFEEIEAITVVDVLRRAQLPVLTVAVATGATEASNPPAITGAHGIPITADTAIEQLDGASIEALVLPGGMPGTTNLQADATLRDLLLQFAREGKPIAAICAAPMVLGHLGILDGHRATIYPGMEAELGNATAVSDSVVVDGAITTSRGPATALPFALALVERFRSADVAREIAAGMVKHHL